MPMGSGSTYKESCARGERCAHPNCSGTGDKRPPPWLQQVHSLRVILLPVHRLRATTIIMNRTKTSATVCNHATLHSLQAEQPSNKRQGLRNKPRHETRKVLWCMFVCQPGSNSTHMELAVVIILLTPPPRRCVVRFVLQYVQGNIGNVLPARLDIVPYSHLCVCVRGGACMPQSPMMGCVR